MEPNARTPGNELPAESDEARVRETDAQDFRDDLARQEKEYNDRLREIDYHLGYSLGVLDGKNGGEQRIPDPVKPEPKRERSRRTVRGVPLVLALGIALSVGISGGVVASVITSQTLSEQAAAYSASASNDPNFPNVPTLSLGTVPSGVSGCSGSPDAFAPSAGNGYSARIVVGVTGASCSPGDWSETLVFTCPASLSTETATIYVETSYGTGPTTYTGSFQVTVTGGTYQQAPVLTLNVDYGSGALPAIVNLSVVVS